VADLGCRCPPDKQDLFLKLVRGFGAREVPAKWHEQLVVVGAEGLAEKEGGGESERGGGGGGRRKGKSKMPAAAGGGVSPSDEEAARQLEEEQEQLERACQESPRELPRCGIYRQQQQLRRLFQFGRRRASSRHGTWQLQSQLAPARGSWCLWQQLPHTAPLLGISSADS
jgi:hypothetical protein